ncbi:MAG: long-chain fatty acid--CoA ligase [Verrucomicrobia bacterium]|nr:MAG: long-chain fatty acid--CoA ligase [Verrucomicrobiota bacterium]
MKTWLAHWRSLGERVAFVGSGGAAVSFAELAQRAEAAVAEGVLADGEAAPGGAVVAFPIEYSARAVVALLAMARAGAIVVPCERALDMNGAVERLEAAGGGRVLAWADRDRLATAGIVTGTGERSAALARLAAAREAGLVLFTGASTGAAKGVLHRLGAFLDDFALRRGEGRRFLPLMAPDHLGGLDMLLRTMATGTTVVDPGDRDVRTVCGVIERCRPDIIGGTPALLNLLALAIDGEPGGVRGAEAVRVVVCGADRLTEGGRTRIARAFPNAVIVSRFGTTETGAVRMAYDTAERCFRPDGTEQAPVAVRDGELWVRLPRSFAGFLDEAAGRGRIVDGWYRTGDRAEMTADGSLRILGRSSHVIHVGGEKVMPEVVEDVVSQHPDVAWCRAYGEAHVLMGEVVALDVVWRRPGASALAVKREIDGFARERLARHARPVQVRLVETVQLTPVGKTSRR